jgi:predicted nucleic acid-binding protein
MLVVSDTSPIRALSFLGKVEVLRELFERVFIPPAVARELAHPGNDSVPIDVSQWGFVEVRPPRDAQAVRKHLSHLHLGEAEALVLAHEVQATIVLIDERTGRKVASDQGFTVVGTLGILLRGKRRGLIQRIGPLLDELVDDLGFFMSEELKRHVLQLAGE